jgi:hypothetical protein
MSHGNSKGGKTLCFEEAIMAFEAKKISEIVYLKHLLAHFSGIRHTDDKDPGDLEVAQLKTEDIAYSVRLMSLGSKYKAFTSDELQLCEQTFQHCVDGDTQNVKIDLENLKDRRQLLIQPLAVLAAKKNQTEIFQLCFEEAAASGVDIDRAVGRAVFQNPATLEFLLSKNWKNIQSSPKALEQFMSASLITCQDNDKPAEVLRWVLDFGVKIPRDEWRLIGIYPPRTDVLELLLVSVCYQIS